MATNIVTGDDVNLPVPGGDSLIPVGTDKPIDVPQAPSTAQEAMPPPAQPNVATPGLSGLNEPPDPTGEQIDPASQMMLEQMQQSPVNMPIRSVQPITSIGLPPWLQNNPNQQPLMPDVSAWRDMLQSVQEDYRPEQTILDLPYAYAQPTTPLVTPGVGDSIMNTFNQMQERNALAALQPRLGGFMRGRYNATPPSNELNSNIAVPGSNRSVLRNEPRYDENPDGRNAIQRFLFGNPTSSLGDTARANENVFGAAWGAMQDVWSIVTGSATPDQREAVQDLAQEFLLANPVTGDSPLPDDREINNIGDTFNRLWRAAPSAQQPIVSGLQNALPEEDSSAVSGFRFDPLQGYFGEFGRGWTGALNTALATPENLVYAGVYTATDLARGLAGEAGDNIPFLRNIPNDGERRGLVYRFGQAFSGVDLDLANYRDGTGNRYLAIVDPNADLNSQIQQWSGALALSAVLGNPIDDLYGAGFRFTRRFGTALQRTGDVGQALEMTRRAGHIASLRSARQSVPNFSRPGSLAQTPVAGEPLTSTPASAVNNLMEYTAPPLNPNQAIFNIAPGELMRAMNDDPLVAPPLPFNVPRTNDELLNLGHELGVIPPEVDFLNNNDINRLQQVYGDTFSRFGHPLNPVPEAPVQAIDLSEYLSRTNQQDDFIFYQGSEVQGAFYPANDGIPGVYEVGFDIGGAVTAADRVGNIPFHELRDLRNAFNAMIEQNPQLRNVPLVASAAADTPEEALMKYRHYMRYDEFRIFRTDLLDDGEVANIRYTEVPYSEMRRSITDGEASVSEFQLIGMNVRGVLQEGDEMIELENSIEPVLRQVQEGQASITRSIAETGEVSEQLERTLSDDILPFNRPAHDGRVVRQWREQEAPSNLRGTEELSRDYLINVDDYEGAARGLQEVEGRIDELRQYVINQGSQLLEGGELSLYRRANMVDEIATQGYYGNVVPGSQVSELLPPVPYGQSNYENTARIAHHAQVIARREGIPINDELWQRAAREVQEGNIKVNMVDLPEVVVRMTPEQVRRAYGTDENIIEVARQRGVDVDGTIDEVIERLRSTTIEERSGRRGIRYVDSLEESRQYLVTEEEIQRRMLEANQPLYHGTKQQFIDRVNFHHGTAHEYGTGLYVTTDPDYATLAANAARTINNPVPGTTRLAPQGTGMVYQINAKVDNLLDGNAPASFEHRLLFNDVATSVFGSRFGSAWARELSGASIPNKELWIRTRELYADTFGTPVPEIKFREFSNRVNAELKTRGIDGIRDERGVINLFADSSGRIPMDAIPSGNGLVDSGRVGSTYARQKMDAMALTEFPESKTMRAWELQSRVQFGNAMMEDMLNSYNPAVRQTNEMLTDMLDAEKRLRDDVIATEEQALEDLIVSADEAANNTPDFQQFKNTPPEEPCL